MNNKILISIIVIALVILGFFILSKTPESKCGDGVCDAIEQEDLSLCPADCQDIQQIESCGPNNNGYCIDFRGKCEVDYEGIGPDKCRAERSANCCLPVEMQYNYKDSPFGIHTAAKRNYISENNTDPPDINVYKSWDYKDASNIGIKWNRPLVYSFYPFYQEQMDIIYGNVPKGINNMANIRSPRIRGTFKLSISDEEYKNFIREVVERYDGDGYNDMPGLNSPVKYWQLDNEPPFFQYGIDDNLIPLNTPLDFETKAEWVQNSWEDYAYLLEIAGAEIKSSCADCKFLIGGMIDVTGDDQNLILNEFYKPILERLNGRYIDIFDFHYYGLGSGGGYKYSKPTHDLVRNLLDNSGYNDAEIWVTETSTYNNQPVNELNIPAPYQSEEEQASDLIKRYVYSLSAGVKKIFWALGMVEGEYPLDNNDRGDNDGLIYDGVGPNDLGYGTKKLAYYTYKKMTETLEGSDWNNIETIQESGGIYIYKFNNNGKNMWVAWNDNSGSQTVSLSDLGITGSAEVTEAIPKYDAGLDVTDYSTAFNTYTTVSDIVLGESPVFVEEN